MRSIALAHSRSQPSTHPLLWLMLAGQAMAAIDLGIAARYWIPRGLPVERMLQGFAEWVMGTAAYHGGAATALLGAAVYGMALSAVLLAFHALAARIPALVRHPVPFGALYGIAAYLALFHLLAPLLTGRPGSFALLDWVVTCLFAFVTVIGIPGALLSRALHGAGRRRG